MAWELLSNMKLQTQIGTGMRGKSHRNEISRILPWLLALFGLSIISILFLPPSLCSSIHLAP